MSQIPQLSSSLVSNNSSEAQATDVSQRKLNNISVEEWKRARRLSINNRELLIAISENNFERVKQLVNGEIDINFQDRDGNTPLNWALKTQNLDVIKLLLKKEEDVKYEQSKILINYVKTFNRPDILQMLEASLKVKLKADESVPKTMDKIDYKMDDLHECQKENNVAPEGIGQVDCKLGHKTQYKNIDRTKHENERTDNMEHEEMNTSIIQLDQKGIDTTFSNLEELKLCQKNKHKRNHRKQVTAIHGYIYQLKLLMLFLYRGVCQHYSFRLGTEIVEARKFDDLVFEHIQDGQKVYRLLQAKHKQDESKKITAFNLLTEKNGDYNLIKYFISYQNSKEENLFKNGSIKDVTICTNIDWDYEDLEKAGITLVKQENEDDVFDINAGCQLESINKQSLRYKFGQEVVSLLQLKLKDYNKAKSTKEPIQCTSNEVQDFLNHLVFAVNQPNEEELGKIVEDEIGREFGFITTENVYNKLFIKMLDWLKNKNTDRFLSYKEGKEFFEEARTGISVWFNIKNPTQVFVGRIKQLNDLHRMLQAQSKNQVQFTSVSGLGGVGKSEIVKQYINQYSQQYDNRVIWINAESYRTLVESFHRLACDELRICTINADNKEKDISSIVEDVYKFFSRGKCLFIFDNAEKYKSVNESDYGIENFLPHLPPDCNKPYILITSRNKKWPDNVEVLELDVFTEDEAIEFIQKTLNMLNETQGNDIKELISQLHFLPLALQQAVAHIKVQSKKLKNVGQIFRVCDYLKKYKEKAEEVLDFKFSESTSNDYAQTIFTAWNITLDMIKQKENGDDALEILYIASYLAPEDIPTQMFVEIMNDSDKLASALELLKQYSMINIEHTAVNVHRLVQHVIRIKLEEQNLEEEVITKALKLFLVQKVNSDNLNHAIHLVSICKKYNTIHIVKPVVYISHLIAEELVLVHRYDEAYTVYQTNLNLFSRLRKFNVDTTINEQITKNQMGLVCIQLEKYETAYEIFQKIYYEQRSITGQYGLEILPTINNLATALFHLGEYAKALQMQKDLLDAQLSLGFSDIRITYTKYAIAKIYISIGKYNDALRILEEVYNIQKRELGIHHPSTLSTKESIAHVYIEQCKWDDALNIHRELCEVENSNLKSDQGTINAMRINAGILVRQEKYSSALEVLEKLLCTQKAIVKDDKLAVWTISNSIAQVYYFQGKFDDAMALCQDILNKQKQNLRPDHPYILRTLISQAKILESQHKYDSALKLYKKILSQGNSVLGNDNPELLNVRHAIARIHAEQGNYEDAFISCQELFQIQKKNLGEDHMDTLSIKNSFGMVLYNMGKYDDALKVFKEVYAKMQILYPNHTSTHDIKNNIGLVLTALKHYDEALKLFTEVLNSANGDVLREHPVNLQTKNNIASILILQGKYKESFQYLYDVFEGNIQMFGPENPDTVLVRDNIQAMLLFAIDRNDIEAIKYFFERDKNITVANFDSALLFHFAVDKCNADILNVLLNSGADPTVINNKGKTALHVAACKNDGRIIEVLLRYITSDKLSSFINAKTTATGSTALHVAVAYGHLEVVKLLLTNGAIYNLKNDRGKTPFVLSKDHSITTILKLVDDLFEAAKNGNRQLIKRLRGMQHDVFKAVTNARNNQNRTLRDVIDDNKHQDLLTKYLKVLTSM